MNDTALESLLSDLTIKLERLSDRVKLLELYTVFNNSTLILSLMKHISQNNPDMSTIDKEVFKQLDELLSEAKNYSDIKNKYVSASDFEQHSVTDLTKKVH